MEGKESFDLVDILIKFDLIELMHDVILGKYRFGLDYSKLLYSRWFCFMHHRLTEEGDGQG